ncbi:RNA methyltransferase, partial [Rhizobiaceae sp. 2RAB30]
GAGAFALRLAAKAEIHAVEADAAALAALDRGFRFTAGLKRITSERRDLFRRPLTFKELNAFDAVVFDPPRAGAEDQSKQIARSDVPLVAAISCNPVTLARDLRVLIDGGYTLKGVTPVDQFLWSAHVEAVALLEKPRRRR